MMAANSLIIGAFMRKVTRTGVAISWISLISTLLSITAAAAHSAVFLKADTTTAGSWIGAYGIDGYIVSQDGSIKIPGYAQLTFTGNANWTWAASTIDVRALQKPEKPSDRIAGTWFASSSFTIDVNLTDGKSHQVALYALDWDANGRAETIEVYDATTSALLDSRTLSAGTFQAGAYLVWNVQGHIKFEVERNAGPNAVVSGLFFGTSSAAATLAVPVNKFLSSLGVNTHIEQGYPEINYEPMFRYTGVRNTRDGSTPGSASQLVTLHKNTGVLVDVFGTNLPNVLNSAQTLACAGALLSVEGPNEPNNFPIIYNGQQGGGSGTWLPVAQYQRDLYAQVKASPTLKNYPIFAVSEGGAEVDNVGLQFLTIPAGATTVMPVDTKYADYANPHNYVTGHELILYDNQAWNAADPILRSHWDGLSLEYGLTWAHGFTGYSDTQLQTLARVTTETGWGTQGVGALTEVQQGKIFLNMYLDQFKRGWRYTFIYQMRDNEGGDTRSFGLYHADLTPKIAANYLHNFTTILADNTTLTPGTLTYSVLGETATVHDLLMQKSDGTFYLAVWDERAGAGVDNVTVTLGGTHTSVKVYDPTIGTTAVKTLSNISTVALTLGFHPLILAISN
jgi:hypothetical protein